MTISRTAIPNWTIKECVYIAFALVAATLAGYGTWRLGWAVFGLDSLTDLVVLVVFGAALSLMIKGIDAIQKERVKKAMEYHPIAHPSPSSTA